MTSINPVFRTHLKLVQQPMPK